MADTITRINRERPGYYNGMPQSSPISRFPSSDPDSALDSGVQGNEGQDMVAEMVLSSRVYKDAHELFSSNSRYGGPFLQQLELIPYSASVRLENTWDSVVSGLGGTSGYENAIQDAFNVCLDEIRALVQNYYNFINTLPAEQVQQFEEAGINSAVTGQGIEGSDMSGAGSAGVVNPQNPSMSTYSNEQLSRGITSFVEFIGSMTNLGSTAVNTAVNAKNLMGLLDLAEREGYNKQELHDLLLAGEGVTTPSPYRVLTPENTPTIKHGANVAGKKVQAESAAMDKPIQINVGDDPNGQAHYEIYNPVDVLTEITRFNMANRFAEGAIKNLRNVGRQQYASLVGMLEGEYEATNFSALIEEGKFNKDFFSAREGLTEGAAQTKIADHLKNIKELEERALSFEQWLNDYRFNILDHWGDQLSKRPNLAPYFYKALFDFNMEDTFYHQNAAAQGLKYGLKSLESVGSFIEHLTGFKKPAKAPRKAGQVTVTDSPKGTTTSRTEILYEE